MPTVKAISFPPPVPAGIYRERLKSVAEAKNAKGPYL